MTNAPKHNPYDLKNLTAEKMEELQYFIADMVDYLEDRMDCDMEDGHYIPNDEMKLISQLNQIFGIRPC